VTELDLGRLLREKRSAARLTQQDVAQVLGLHPNTVARWEGGGGLETVAKFFDALDACGVTVKVVSELSDAPSLRDLAGVRRRLHAS